MSDTKRETRISDEESQMIQTAFAGNTKALKLLRKVFYQEALTEEEDKILRLIFAGGHDLLEVMKKLFLPRLSVTDPIGGAASAWIDRKYADMLSEEVRPAVLARQDCLEALDNGLKRIRELVEGGKAEPLLLSIDLHMDRDYSGSSPEETKRAVVAMQDFAAFVEMSGILQLESLANAKKESPEERAARLKADSSK